MNLSRRLSAIIIIMQFIIVFHLPAQNRSLANRYNPVVITGDQLPLSENQIADWTLYSFNAATAQWQPIPFQMDEVDESGNFLHENDGYLDANDELLFMPDDARDRASQNQWLDGTLMRIELQLTNPQHPDQKAWVYLYKDVQNDAAAPGYFHYIPTNDQSTADTIQTMAYKLGHNHKGWTDFVSFSFDWRQDVLDRVKFHVNSNGLLKIYLTEDTLNFSTEQFYQRPVRSFQKVKSKIKLSIPPFPALDREDTFLISFFPYSTSIGAGFTVDNNTKGLLALLGIQNIRLSIDFAAGIQNMKFYSTNNPNGIAVDGAPDNPNIQLPDTSGTNWVMASGDDGTILAFFQIPKVGGVEEKTIYYRDNNSGGTNEGTDDTGDLKSYGDMGLWLKAGQDGAILPQSDSLFIAFDTYYINEKNKTAQFGTQVLGNIQNPLFVEANVQSKTTAVDNKTGQPHDFVLYDMFPNPFHANSETAVFQFRTGFLTESPVLRIYNINGQEVAIYRFKSEPGKIHSFRWNGISANGKKLPTGIYFYRLQAGSKTQIKKMLLLR